MVENHKYRTFLGVGYGDSTAKYGDNTSEHDTETIQLNMGTIQQSRIQRLYS